MALDEEIKAMEEVKARMEYVKDGQYVFARQPNTIVDFLTHAVEATKLLYDEFKVKTGKTLPFAELMISMAESRLGMTRKVKYGDLVLTKDHNLLIDTMKPLELALREIEENLP